MRPNVIELVKDKNSCIGCGICAALCPSGALEMKFDGDKFEVFLNDGCLSKCTICVDLCTFAKPKNLNKSKLLGESFKTYSFAGKNREFSSSGGAVSFVLDELFKSGEIDRVICAGSSKQQLFEYKVYGREFLKGSVYYPLSLDKALEFVLKNDMKFAVVALPCYASSLKEAMKRNVKLRKRIKFLIALTCGGMKSAKFTTHLANAAFGEKTELQSVNYRKKIPGKSAMQFAYEFVSTSGKKALDDRSSSWRFWSSRAFTPLACNNCDDVFGVSGDMSVMDAWLDEFVGDYMGHSLVISKNAAVDKILLSGGAKEISKDKILLSQQNIIKEKFAFKHGTRNLILARICKLKLEIQQDSLKAKFDKLETNLAKIQRLEKISWYLKLPKIILKKIVGRI